MRPLCLLLAVLLSVTLFEATLTAQVKKQFNTGRDPSRSSAANTISDRCFRTVLENGSVRVYKVDVPPHQSTTLIHRSHDYLIVSIGKNNLEISGGAVKYPFQLDDGEMQVISGGWSQRLVNLSDNALRLLQVDVSRNIHPKRSTCGLAARACTDGRFGKTEEGSYTASTLFETDTVKLARIQLGPGGVLPAHRHDHPHVLLALDTVEFDDEAADGKLRLNAGDAHWYAESITHRLKNVADREVRVLTLELK